jgi:phytoene dehydrogenase-like protein
MTASSPSPDPSLDPADLEVVRDRALQNTQDGFGQLWHKRYEVVLAGVSVTPEEVIGVWRERYGEFWPGDNTFHAPLTGLEPGEMAIGQLEMPAGTSLTTGVVVIDISPTSFTFQTPQGHLFAGTIRFSATTVGDEVAAAIDIIFRASDPLFELAMPLGGHKQEDIFWLETLANLARALGVRDPQATLTRELLDKDRLWANATNVIRNGFVRTQVMKLRALPGKLAGAAPMVTPTGGTRPTDARSAVVIGAGPNGLAAALTLAEAGQRVRVLEANATVGGGCRSGELTLPGFLHDTCSAVHPLAVSSPFFRTLNLEGLGVEWIEPPVAFAHPFDDGTALTLRRSVTETAAGLGVDEEAWLTLMMPLLKGADQLMPMLLGPFRIPRHPVMLARFGVNALQPATFFAEHRFKDEKTRGFFAGLAAHSILPLETAATTAFGIVLALSGHLIGWPIPRGGSQRIVDAMAARLKALGGEIETGVQVRDLDQVSGADAVLFDTSPRQFLAIAGDAVGGAYRRQLEHYRYGAGVFKVDWALSGPVPWTAPEAHEAGTLHLGGTLDEIAFAEGEVGRGRVPERPFVLVSQPSRFDASRAPVGMHTLWGYCHVPNGSTEDMTKRIEAQIERFAPGFRNLIVGRSTMDSAQMETYNANYIGGDINAGMQDLRQLYTRPAIRRDPYSTPDPRLFFCSASTPPGGGVHGMCGYHAARSVLRRQG